MSIFHLRGLMRSNTLGLLALALLGPAAIVSAKQAETDYSPIVSLQVNMCYLHEDSDWKDVEALDDSYHVWMKKNGVERIVVRQTPLMFAGRPERPLYLDFHIGSHQTTGKAWKLWRTTTEGQSMNEEWGRIADCRVMMTTMYRKYIGTVAETGQQRVLEINWCSKNKDKSWQQLAARHIVPEGEAPGGGNAVFWGVMVPQIGGHDMPGDFAHLMTYPDMEAFMAKQAWFDLEKGGERYQDYNSSYASCRGSNLFSEEILYMTDIKM